MGFLENIPLLHDNLEYVKMSQGFSALSPYCYRPAVPWLVNMTGLDHARGFFLVNVLSALLSFWFFFEWLKTAGYSSRFSWMCVGIWAATSHSPLAQAFLTFGVDPPATALGLAAILAVERRQYLFVLVLMSIGPTLRETTLIAGAYALWRRGWWGPLLSGIGTYILLLTFIRPGVDVPGSYWFGLHKSWWLYLKNPLNMLAGFWIAFGPLGFLWVLCPKPGNFRDPKRFLLWAGILACFCGGVGRERFLNWFPVMIPMALLSIQLLPRRQQIVAVGVSLLAAYSTLSNANTDYWLWNSSGYLWLHKLLFSLLGLTWLFVGWMWRKTALLNLTNTKQGL